MKRRGSLCEFKRLRDRCLLRLYRLHLRSARGRIDLRGVYAAVVASPAPRFWVSEERAAEVVALALAGRPLPPMRPTKAAMFAEIARRVEGALRGDPSLPVEEAVAAVVNSPAPCQYLTPLSAREYVYRLRRALRSSGERGEGVSSDG